MTEGTGGTGGTGDDASSSSSDSSDEETIGTVGTKETTDPEDAKARLRAKIRAQAGSLLTNKGPPVAAVSAKKRSDSAARSARKPPPPPAPAVVPVVVPSPAAPVTDDDESQSMDHKQQRTGEQSEESPQSLLKEEIIKDKDDPKGDESESLNSSKRSVRFEGELDAAEKGNMPESPPDQDESQISSKGAPDRPSLQAFKSVGEDEMDESGAQIDFELKEEVACSDGATTGMILCAVFMVTWAIAMPIALAFRPKGESDDGSMDPTLAPSLPDGVTLPPAMAPDSDMTASLL